MSMSGTMQLSPFDVLKTYVPSNATDSPAELGAIGTTPDGRRFKLGFIAAGATTLAPGKLTQGPAIVSARQAVTCSAQSIGDTQITITFSAGTAVTANQYSGGFIGIISGTGSVSTYQILSHPSATASATTLVLTLVDPIVVATSGNPIANVWANPMNGLIVMPTTLTGVIAGIPMVSVVADATFGTYAWVQTNGLALALNADTSSAGAALTYDTDDAGALMTAGAGNAIVGYAVQAGVDTAYSFVNLQIA